MSTQWLIVMEIIMRTVSPDLPSMDPGQITPFCTLHGGPPRIIRRSPHRKRVSAVTFYEPLVRDSDR